MRYELFLLIPFLTVFLGQYFHRLTALYGDYHLKMSKEKDTDQVEVEEPFVDRFV